MNKIVILFAVALFASAGIVHGQAFGSVDNETADTAVQVDYERGFTAQIEATSNLFQVTDVRFSDAAERDRRTDFTMIDNFPFGATNFLDGTSVRFGFNGDWFGGAFSANRIGIGGVRAWVGFLDNRLRVSVGNDIGYSFADAQGAGAGLRVYDDHVRNVGEGEAENTTVDSNKNPDNITGGQGVLFEVLLDPITIAFAAGGNIGDLTRNIGSVLMVRTGTFTQEAVYGHSMHYGLNIGGRIGDFARVNTAYIFRSEKQESMYEYNASVGRIVPRRPDAHIMTHQFGLYGSLYPMRDDSLGITVGYAGVLVRYLDEFLVGAPTVQPMVLKNGINFAARYRIGDLTLKTDHNYSFWTDKNYRIFNLHRPHVDLRDWGLMSADTVAADMADVRHSFLWNGAGASYRFTQVLEGSVYARNLVRIDETPQFRMLNNYFSVELRSTFHLGQSVEAFVGFVFDYTGRSTSRDLSATVGEFPSAFTPRDTMDSRTMIQVPIGLTVRLQRD
ncbi:MAG: hypothetical protein FWD88_02645 [Treponema sp.]|nr:hypothetical protein [Treponema sp.]